MTFLRHILVCRDLEKSLFTVYHFYNPIARSFLPRMQKYVVCKLSSVGGQTLFMIIIRHKMQGIEILPTTVLIFFERYHLDFSAAHSLIVVQNTDIGDRDSLLYTKYHIFEYLVDSYVNLESVQE